MHAVGRPLTVKTQNVRLEGGFAEVVQSGIPPGAFVMLAVPTMALGWTRPTQARIFEPFSRLKKPAGHAWGCHRLRHRPPERAARSRSSVSAATAQLQVYLPAVAGESQ